MVLGCLKVSTNPTPKRSKIDFNINIDFDAKPMGAGHEVARRLWARDLPRELPEAAQGHHGTALPGTQAAMGVF